MQSRWVDPFIGNGVTDLPPQQGLVAGWFWRKAQIGQTHPGACYPFGMVSVCAYSGAYSTGYGLYDACSSGMPARKFNDYTATGFTHFQTSGIGNIRLFYNYLRVIPIVGGLDQVAARWKLQNEIARPGYYAADFEGTGIRTELTVTRHAAFHRYTFPPVSSRLLAVDVSEGGIDFPKNSQVIPSSAKFDVSLPGIARGFVVMAGVPLYFHLETNGALVSACGVWQGGTEMSGQTGFEINGITGDTFKPFGFFFKFGDSAEPCVNVRIGFSFRSVDRARINMGEIKDHAFEQVAEGTRKAWDEMLSRVAVAGGPDDQQKIFNTALYHSLIKPIDLTGECPYWESDEPCYLDIATMWDMYKTQLPLVMTAYPEHGRGIVNCLLAFGRHFGRFPHCTLISGLSADLELFDSIQARGLAHIIIADALVRGITGIDWQEAKELMVKNLMRSRNDDFINNGVMHPLTHALDLAYACYCTAQVAKKADDLQTNARMMRLAANWKNAYDPATAKLGKSTYYEGSNWNYSFRLLHDMSGRIALYGSEDAFVRDLDLFFGYGQPPCRQMQNAPHGDLYQQGCALNRFEGLNNEPDMETPYAYIYAGRHDRTAEIVRTVLKSNFALGRGGLPGNDDSGSLSSWYVWNVIGIFPVAGQDIYLIGSPIFESACVRMGQGELMIKAKNNSERNLYVKRATFNGKPLERAYLRHSEICRGGNLVLEMDSCPSSWAGKTRPPSYR